MKTSDVSFFEKKSTYTDFDAFCRDHLPEFDALDRYENRWRIFGTLTYGLNPPLPSTQLKNFEELMKSLAKLNHSDADQLRWFVRVEKSESGRIGRLDAGRWHMHFLLDSNHRVENGHHNPLTIEQTCEFLAEQWKRGDAVIEPYRPCDDGVAYITEIDRSNAVPFTRFSKSLFKVLKKAPSSDRRKKEIERIARYKAEGRDPFTTELIIKLSRTGSHASFGDEATGRMAA